MHPDEPATETEASGKRLSATLGYFCAPSGHLWEWSPDQGTQEAWWHRGRAGVLAFREELVDLLQALAVNGLPPLGSVLLVNAAASGRWQPDAAQRMVVQAVEHATGNAGLGGTVEAEWNRAFHGLQQINALPPALRAFGEARRHLLRSIFDGTTNRLPPDVSAEVLWEFQATPSLVPFIRSGPGLNGVAAILRDLMAVGKALDGLTTEMLEQRLRTGMDFDAKDGTEVDLPEEELSGAPQTSSELLEALEREGGEPAQVAGLARRLSALLHVPKPVSHQDDLPVGGVSDITNRGEPDRLLLTELMWDDAIFAARLAHGEALYSRRESPPSEPPPQRIILLDNGIHLWGKPRLYALGATLALLHQAEERARKQGGPALPGAAGEVCTLSGGDFLPVDLRTVEDVRAQLSRLEPRPHAAEALAALLDGPLMNWGGRTEVFFITHPAAMEPVAQSTAWRHLSAQNSLHALEVDREGRLLLTRHTASGRRVVGHSQLNLEDIAPVRRKSGAGDTLTDESGRLPRFYRQRPWPLYHPALPADHLGYLLPHGLGSVGISILGCICHWSDDAVAGRVLHPHAVAGKPRMITFSHEEGPRISLEYDNRRPGVTLVMTMLLDGSAPALTIQIPGPSVEILAITVQSGALVVHRVQDSFAYSLQDGSLLATHQSVRFSKHPQHLPWFDGADFHDNHPTEVRGEVLSQVVMPRRAKHERIEKVTAAGFSEAGGLLIRKELGRTYALKLGEDHSASWQTEHTVSWQTDFEGRGMVRDLVPLELPDGMELGLTYAAFPDGRRIVCDPRGFLHVTGWGDEVSIVLVKGGTVLYAAGLGYVCAEGGLMWDETVVPVERLKPLTDRLFAPAPRGRHRDDWQPQSSDMTSTRRI